MTASRGFPSVTKSPDSAARRLQRWRVLLAHDTRAATCDALVGSLELALPHLELVFASSVEDARVALDGTQFDAILVCLDLPPAPAGGVRLGQLALTLGLPLVLVTRSLRWLPVDAADLRNTPWVQPDASPEDVLVALLAMRNDSAGRSPAPEPTSSGVVLRLAPEARRQRAR